MARRGTDAKRASALLQRLPEKVCAARSRRGVSQQQAAREIGIGKATLQRIESGSGRADISTLVKVFAWLDGEPVKTISPGD